MHIPVAIDNLFTDIEQEWVDSNFGIGSSNHFARVIEIVNWDSFFPHLHSLTWSLSDDDKIWLKANCERLFRELLESDGLDPEEEKQLSQLLSYIKSAC